MRKPSQKTGRTGAPALFRQSDPEKYLAGSFAALPEPLALASGAKRAGKNKNMPAIWVGKTLKNAPGAADGAMPH